MCYVLVVTSWDTKTGAGGDSRSRRLLSLVAQAAGFPSIGTCTGLEDKSYESSARGSGHLGCVWRLEPRLCDGKKWRLEVTLCTHSVHSGVY